MHRGPICAVLLCCLLVLPAVAAAVDDRFPPPLAASDQEMAAQPVVAASFTTSATPSFEERVVELVNVERWNNGKLPPLKAQANLNSAAEGHSGAMAQRDFFAHCDLDTRQMPGARAVAAGYPSSYVAENIGAGYTSPESAMNGWMNSTGHRNNILGSWRDIGVGYSSKSSQGTIRRDRNVDCTADGTDVGYGRYWTQNFGSASGYPLVIERERFQTASQRVALYLYAPAGAAQMRLRNEGGLWTPWLTYQTNYGWSLSLGDGWKTVSVEVRTSTGSVASASDTILLSGSGTVGAGIFQDGFEAGSLAAWSGL